MADSLRFQIPAQVVPVLEQLAETLIPLADWIGSKTYVPPDPDLPWRKPDGAKLAPKDLGIIKFLQRLIDDSDAYARLVQRLKQVEADPLGLSPVSDIARWRSDRGLKPNAQFGIVKSNNVLVADGQPIVRAEYYGACFAALLSAQTEATKQPDFAWSAFLDALVSDNSAFWPAHAPKSSAFIWQFVDDVLYAMLGMQNDAPDPVKFALLIELGERRRVGNRYGPQDAKAAVDEFEDTYNHLAGTPAPQETYAAIHPPVGSPPTTTKPV